MSDMSPQKATPNLVGRELVGLPGGEDKPGLLEKEEGAEETGLDQGCVKIARGGEATGEGAGEKDMGAEFVGEEREGLLGKFGDADWR